MQNRYKFPLEIKVTCTFCGVLYPFERNPTNTNQLRKRTRVVCNTLWKFQTPYIDKNAVFDALVRSDCTTRSSRSLRAPYGAIHALFASVTTIVYTHGDTGATKIGSGTPTLDYEDFQKCLGRHKAKAFLLAVHHLLVVSVRRLPNFIMTSGINQLIVLDMFAVAIIFIVETTDREAISFKVELDLIRDGSMFTFTKPESAKNSRYTRYCSSNSLPVGQSTFVLNFGLVPVTRTHPQDKSVSSTDLHFIF